MEKHPIAIVFAVLQFLVGEAAFAETAIFNGRTVNIIETAGSAVDFYRSNGARNVAPVPVNDDGLNFFFHKDTTTDVYSLGLVVDNNDDGTGGRLQGSISGLNSGSFVAVADDNAREFSMPTPNTAVFNFRWISRWTDGGVISGIDINNLNLSIDITNSTGLTDIHVLDATGTQLSLGITPSSGVNLSVAPSPEPTIWALMIMGFIGIAWRLKESRRHFRSEFG